MSEKEEKKEGPISAEELPMSFQVSYHHRPPYPMFHRSGPGPSPAEHRTTSSFILKVKYLGQSDARGLWGIKHTRRPVDLMVSAAKALPPGQILPIVKLKIALDGVHLETLDHGTKTNEFEHMTVFFNIESISYGVQDLVYTRVFSMIIVKDNADVKGLNPFECHGFVCESRNAARRLTYSLAAAFQDYSRRVKAMQASAEYDEVPTKKRFAIDLRTPEEIEADLETEA